MTIDRTPRTVTTSRATITVRADGITVAGELGADANEYTWQDITTEAFEALGGVEAVESAVVLNGSLVGQNEDVSEFFAWR